MKDDRYEQLYRKFQWNVPERFNFARDIVARHAQDPGLLALFWTDETGREEKYTFAQLHSLSNQFANVMAGLGIGKGDVVLVILPRVPAWQVVMLGLLKLGAIAAPGATLLQPKDIAYRIQLAGARALVTDVENCAKVESIGEAGPGFRHRILVGGSRPGWASYDEEMKRAATSFTGEHSLSKDPALIFFTSGTTGGPKMVLHSHAYTWAHRLTGEYWIDLKPTDLHWNMSDTGWAKAAYSTLFGPWHSGCAVFSYKGNFEPRKTLEMLEKYKITTFCAPPTAFRLLVKEDLKKYRFSLRHVVGAGEPLNPEVIEVWKEGTGQTIYDGYGQTESIIVVCNHPSIPVRPGSMGKPMPGHEIAIVDGEGNELPADEEGEIAVKGHPPSLFLGYWKEPELTQSTRRGPWYVTGDKAYRDQDGYYWFVGRADDVIISAGYRIGPFEVESALIEHPAVVEAAAVASPDEVRGDIVKAFVVLRSGYQGSPELVRELQDHVKKVTAPYKYPREIEFVEQLPKTISGKIRRVELRKREVKKKQASSASS
ncbi:MAG: acyl--CoA ligase [Acidobacteriia bacterium]|nr:acyl--CoA ligase [Terriglobia bacterium]